MGNGGKGGREWKREGRNDRRLNVGKGREREGQEGMGKKEKRRKGREGKGRKGICPIFESLPASIHGYTNTRPFRQYPGV
jgi:hypothetical protein